MNCELPSVTSLAEVWIEISEIIIHLPVLVSLPSRKCGLKSSDQDITDLICYVTSLAEVWIEISQIRIVHLPQSVTSLAEVWIEIPVWTRRGRK